MKILIGCEESQIICKAFRDKGHDAYSCDLKPCSGEHPEWHIQEDIVAVASNFRFYTSDRCEHFISEWDMAIIHPPCTYLCVTANKWFKDQPERKSGALIGHERRLARGKAYEFFMACWNLPIKKMCLENPVGVMSTYWRKPDQIIQPFEFGHPEPKKTCLWLRNLPLLIPTKKVEPEYHITKSGKRLPKWYAYADKSQGQEQRASIRSKTFTGIASAMAEQWS